jgi:hypothetical protein
MNVFVLFDVVNDPQEVSEELFVPAVVKTLNITFYFRKFH